MIQRARVFIIGIDYFIIALLVRLAKINNISIGVTVAKRNAHAVAKD